YGFLYSLVAVAGGLVPSLAVRTIAVAGIVAAAGLLAWQLRAPLPPLADRAVVALLATCLVPYVPFVIWWRPDHTVHWQLVLIPPSRRKSASCSRSSAPRAGWSCFPPMSSSARCDATRGTCWGRESSRSEGRGRLPGLRADPRRARGPPASPRDRARGRRPGA